MARALPARRSRLRPSAVSGGREKGLPNEPREESWLGFTLLKLPLDDLTQKHEREPQNHEREPQNHEARNELAQVEP